MRSATALFEGERRLRSRPRQAREPGARAHRERESAEVKTRITQLLGIEHPIFQAAMSWASSNAPLVIAVSNAGGMGVLGAGPMRPEDFSQALDAIKAGTTKPYGVNIPLNGARAAEPEIACAKRIPVMVASQGGPESTCHASAPSARNGFTSSPPLSMRRRLKPPASTRSWSTAPRRAATPPPSNVSTLVLVRRVVRATRLPVVASGGVADGAGIAALLALGAEAVQLGTRFIATPEASVHENCKRGPRRRRARHLPRRPGRVADPPAEERVHAKISLCIGARARSGVQALP